MLENISDSYYNKGLIHFQNNDLTTAKGLFQKAINFNPKVSHYYNIQGLCLYQLGEFNKTKIVWEQSMSLENKEHNSAYKYLKMLDEEGFQNLSKQYNKAYDYALNQDFKKAIDLIKNNHLQDYNMAKINNFCGLCYYGKGNRTKAFKVWQGVLKNDTTNPQALQYLSQIDIQQNGLNKTIDKFKKLLKRSL